MLAYEGMWILYVLPKKVLSQLFGQLMHIELPGFLRIWSLRFFAQMYKLNMSEAEKDLNQYRSIGDLFTRKLKAGMRPLSESPILHPADSVISQAGPIHAGQCLQAKDRQFSLMQFIQDENWVKTYSDGVFVTYYLCPTDYHRVHSPVDGQILSWKHIPGNLWPVNSWSTENIENLFAVNERVILEIESRLGPCLLVFVGATNVGQISLSFDSHFRTNSSEQKKSLQKKLNPVVNINRGQELGVFHMGSTVVMIYPNTIRMQKEDWSSFHGKAVKYGQALL